MLAKEKPLCLITGGAGYAGHSMIRKALASGWRVRCLDLLIYGGKSVAGFMNHPNFELVHGDVRDKKTVEAAVDSVTAIVHLAAIVGDLPCQVAPKSANQINFKGTQLIADVAKKKGVSRLIFASTCSNYGAMPMKQKADENFPLNPVSLYAETKINCEKYLATLASAKFHPTCLRFGTAFGVSQRTRFDLLVNSFVYEAFFKGELMIFGAAMCRPFIHVVDMATITLKVLEAEDELVSNQIFNAGSSKQNFTKDQIAKMIVEQLPEVKLKYPTDIDDKRNYCVDFTKLEKVTGFEPTRSVPEGIRELVYCFRHGILTAVDYESNNLDHLKIFFKEQENKLANNY